ncbi:unnamed protein product [Ectocarpus sp. 6 AP-2014]
MSCRAAPPTVSFRGQLLRRHEPLSPWSLTRTVTSLHRKGMSWTAVYWFLWGLTQPLYCVRCREVFLAGDIGHCRSHPQQAFFPGDSGCGSSTTGAGTTGTSGEERGSVGVGAADGYYPCCQSPVNRFSLEPPPLGCVSLDHVVRDADEDPLVLRVLQLQRANISYQARIDWRDAVHEETIAVVKSAVGPGSNGGGTNSTGGSGGGSIGAAGDVATGKGGTNDASTNYGSRGNSSGGDGVRGGGGGSGSGIGGTDKVPAKRQASAGSKRPPRGPDFPPAVVTTTTTTTTTSIAATGSSGGRSAAPKDSGSSNSSGGGTSTSTSTSGSSSSGNKSGQMTSSSSSSSPTARVAAPPAAGQRPASAGSKANGGSGGIGDGGASSGRAGDAAATPGDPPTPAGLPAGGISRDEGGTVVVPTAATGMNCRRIWEVRASEVLSDRERGLLPNEHPVQRVSLQGGFVDWDNAPRDCSRMAEGQARRWQTDALRENDGLRIAKMCDDLRRKRRGKQLQQELQ